MYNVGKALIIDLVIEYYCELNNVDYESLSFDAYSKMCGMCFDLDDITLITRLGELYKILQNKR